VHERPKVGRRTGLAVDARAGGRVGLVLAKGARRTRAVALGAAEDTVLAHRAAGARQAERVPTARHVLVMIVRALRALAAVAGRRTDAKGAWRTALYGRTGRVPRRVFALERARGARLADPLAGIAAADEVRPWAARPTRPTRFVP